VSVTGNTHESAGEVISVTGLDQTPAMIEVNSKSVTNQARSLRWVESITVARHWPHSVTLVVKERHPIAVAADSTGTLYLVDRHGVQLDPPPMGANLPRLEAVGSTSTWPYSKAARSAAAVASKLPVAFSKQVAVVQIWPKGDIRLQLTTPVTFLLGSATNLHDKFVAVASIIAHQPLHRGEVVDVSVPSAVTIQ
jgi:cell division septal protein FtsQ